jgi:hypothetical protein
MKKLVLTLLVSCISGTAFASESDLSSLETVKKACLFGAQKALPAAAGYIATGMIKERSGYGLGFMAFVGLVSTPFIFEQSQCERYKKVSPTLKTTLKSFAFGVAAHEVVDRLPAGAKSRLAALRGK